MMRQLVEIGSLGKVVTGDTPPKKNPEYYGSAYPFIKPTDMQVGQRYTYAYEECYSEAAYEKYRKKLIPQGATAVVTIGSIGQKLTLTHTACFVNQAVNAVIPNKEEFNSFYVYYLLKHNLNLVKSADTGASSGRENVSKSNFSKIQVLVTLDIKEQESIANILDGYDSLIENNQRRIVLLEESVRLLYREWFVNLRFPGHDSGSANSELLSGWVSGYASDFIQVQSGGTPNTKNDRFWNGEIPFFTPKDCSRSSYVLVTEKTLSEDGLASCSSRLFPKETIFITARGTVGKLALAQRPMAMNQSCYALVPKNGMNNLFLFLALEERIAHLKAMASGGVFDAIVGDTFKKLAFSCPPIKLTDDFGDVVRPIFDQIENLLRQNAALSGTRNDLLPKLMAGEIQV